MVEELINEENVKDITLKKYGYPDEFVKHGSTEQIEKKYGLDEETIAKNIMENSLVEQI